MKNLIKALIIALSFGLSDAAFAQSQGIISWGADQSGTTRALTFKQGTAPYTIGTVDSGTTGFFPKIGTTQTTGITGTGTTVVMSVAPTLTGNVSQTNNANTFFYQSAYGTAVAPSFTFVRGRGTAASPTDAQNGDLLGVLDFIDYRAHEGAKIFAQSSENHTNTAGGTQVYFYTTPNGSVTPALAMTLGPDQTIYASKDVNIQNGTNSVFGPSFKLGGDPIGALSLGSTSSVSGNAYLDFHSEGNAQPDARLQVSGGFPSLFGGGLLTAYGTILANPQGADQITVFSGLQQALDFNQYPGSVSPGAGLDLNRWNIGSDNINAGSGFVNGITLAHYFGGSNTQGGRQSFAVFTYLNAATNSSNPNRNYTAISGVGSAITGDGGTGLSGTDSKGAIFGAGLVGAAFNGATNLLNVTGLELNTAMNTGSSVYQKTMLQLSGRPDDKVAGSGIDAQIAFYNQIGAVKWHDIMLVTNATFGEYPMSSTGSILRVDGGTYANGINLSGTITGNAYASNNFQVDGSGNLNASAFSVQFTAGVTCSGTPSGSFASKNGIITHC